MAHTASWFWKSLVVLLLIAWQLLVHVSMGGESADFVRYALLALPLAIFAYWITRQARHKLLWVAMLAVACAAVLAVEQASRLGVAVAYGVPHALVYASLLFVFAHTLLPGKTALITRLARRVHGTLPPYMESYTRRLTIAWSAFFLAQLFGSGLLLAFATLETWSMFINLFNVPLLLLMFAGDYCYRVFRYPDFPHATVAQAMRAFIDDASINRGSGGAG